MITPAYLFPMGTTRGYVFNVMMATIYGGMTSFGTIVQIIIKRKTFFTVKPRPQPPQCLLDSRLGEHHFLQTKNIKLHYVSNGDPNKPLMLFLHGFPEVWYSWRNQLPEFSKDYYTVALSLRGYGDSDRPSGVANYSLDKLVDDVRDFVVGIGKQKCILVSHDWGGLVAWTVSAKYPEIVDRFIVCNAPHIKSFMDTIETNWKQFFSSWYIYFFNIPYLPELRLTCNDLQAFDYIFRKLGTKEDIEAYKYYFSRPGALTGPINYYRALQRNYALDFWQNIKNKKIKAPTLVIWGRNDLALTDGLPADSCKHCDNYTIKMIEDCSHWTPFDKPDIVNKYMRQFLNTKY
ncbi:epoxide hydrolase 4-like [Oppia nitens]|uniref:epoxide hydrolase 4-like n=1 Tax=Oppia nitens TaxID=1686743 RepID=UPI0023DA6B18|nr:epoxide hydrolase 4-like [Oppia nitens]XP_054161802.1 epoxide hydrolase 4-like [Oppia nitens]